MRTIFLFFFVSGFPALLYQLIWQRALFSIFGSNIEAVTLVVSSFMLGLGLGSLFGGRLSSVPKFSPLILFGLFELVIGVFGFVSLQIIDFVGAFTIDFGPGQTFVASFITVLLPTLLLGATLPLLLMHLVRKNGAVGKSVSLLYSINTLGSAFACFLGAVFIFGAFGMQGSVNIAAILNILVGSGALWLAKAEAKTPDRQPSEVVAEFTETEPATGFKYINPAVAIIVAGCAGFISLSYEILWARAFFISFAGKAFAFPFVLGYFLAGIAIGAHLSRRYLGWFKECFIKYNYLPFAILFLVANILSFLTIPVLNSAAYKMAPLVLCAAAAAFGAFLPLVSELSIRPDNTSGKRISYLYVANIVGSTVGTIITGLWLLDTFALSEVAAILFVLGAICIAVLLISQPNVVIRFGAIALTLLAIAPLTWSISPQVHKDLYQTLQSRVSLEDDLKIARVAETKSGVVAISDEKVVYGSGVYDGMVSVDLMNDRNGLFRPAAVAAVHPSPKRVLIIGMSMGAWTSVLANMPSVQQVQVVEIDRGYLELVKEYPEVSSILDNPKIKITIDDGRRWLRRNPDQKFDVIVANTTFHWRSGASNLLSVEFLEQIKSQLAEGGVYFYNSTSSDRVQKTAASIFNHAARFEHFVFASQSPLIFDEKNWLNQIRNWEVDGNLLIDLSTVEGKEKASWLTGLFQKTGPLNSEDELAPALEFKDDILARTPDLDVITDDNMGAEWLFQNDP